MIDEEGGPARPRSTMYSKQSHNLMHSVLQDGRRKGSEGALRC